MVAAFNYRADIDGLRALAVLSVVAYHAFPSAFPGGFIGVDIFFVISGYLISGIIFAGIDDGKFSFIDFYARRARRIFPALAIVLAATLALGWMILLPVEYAKLGQHVLAGVTFTSNFLLMGESGYFDQASSTKPLLHLWSLAIEEQFYLVFPAIVAIAARFTLHRTAVMIAIALLSFAINIAVYQSDPTANFFAPHTRFWELLTGSILATITPRRPDTRRQSVRTALASAGLGMLFVSIFTLTSQTPFPGWAALLPVVGTVLVIYCGPEGAIGGRILGNNWMRKIGLISYPIYLWHWVLLTFMSIWTSGNAAPWQVASAVLLSVALASLTYRLVERPLRFSGPLRPRAAAATVALAAAGICAGAVSLTGGFPQRTGEVQFFEEYFENAPPKLQYMTATGLYDYYRNDCNFYDMQRYRAGDATNIPVAAIAPSCTAEDIRKKTLFLWGDSHVQQLYYGLLKTLGGEWNILIVSSSGCPAKFEEEDSSFDYCVRSNWTATELIRTMRPEVVLVGQARDHDAATMEALASGLLNDGVSGVVMTGPVPRWTAPLWRTIATKYWRSPPERLLSELDFSFAELDRSLKASLRLPEGARYISVIDMLCDHQGCLTRVGKDPMKDISSWDYGHLTLPASLFVAQRGLLRAVVSVAK